MTASMQNHIHLALALGGTPEYSPTATYKVVQESRTNIKTVIASFDRALTGKAHLSTLSNVSGPIIFSDYAYTLKLTEAELDAITDLLGLQVYLVDNLHPDDGEDHTAYVRTMGMINPGKPKMANTVGIYYYYEIYLVDMDTV